MAKNGRKPSFLQQTFDEPFLSIALTAISPWDQSQPFYNADIRYCCVGRHGFGIKFFGYANNGIKNGFRYCREMSPMLEKMRY